MPTILERNQGIANRIAKPQPIAEQIRQLFLHGKREQLLNGTDINGQPFVHLAASTLRYHEGSDTPLVPRGDASQIIARYEVTVEVEPARIRIHAGWPSLDWVKYHVLGGRHLPKRDPSGFRPEDKTAAMRIYRDWIMKK